MNKIIAAFDGLKYSDSTEQYALTIGHTNNAHIVGAFLDDEGYSSSRLYDKVANDKTNDEGENDLVRWDVAKRSASSERFTKACEDAGFEYSVHHDKATALRELIRESLFADLLIVDARETLVYYHERKPTDFIQGILSDAQCPVLLVPSVYQPFQKIIMLYDGTPSSLYAIKMFSYILPELSGLPVEILTVRASGSGNELPESELMKELIKRHYPHAVNVVLTGDPEVKIPSHLILEKENALVVLGAYQRGAVSRWFKKSMADLLQEHVSFPLFIAHRG